MFAQLKYLFRAKREKRKQPETYKLINIRQFEHRMQADHAKSLLFSRNIFSIIEADDSGGFDAMAGAFSYAKLMVHEKHAEKADLLLREFSI